jgi:hypothetical protein
MGWRSFFVEASLNNIHMQNHTIDRLHHVEEKRTPGRTEKGFLE